MEHSELRDRLRRLGVTRGAERVTPPPRRKPRPIEELLPGEILATEQGSCFLHREHYPLDYRHGGLSLSALLEHPAHVAALLARDERLAALDPTRWAFVDTETTGLAGGVGTRAFMIGSARWCADRLTVRQLYLTTMAGEAAMLRLFNAWLDPAAILVSYNGKSYDAPLLKGRLRLNHVDHRLAELPHLDWLHPVRRRYRGVFENCRLATIERQALRIVRDDDLPGAQAPAAWLAFLRGESSRNLARVLDHNRQDVVTLMRLSDHMAASDPAAP